ncbi:MAG: c-type cytochrome domain-containing protein, partial [Planctomycetaceae bacterium]
MSAVSHSLRALTKCLAQLPLAVALGLPLFACTTVTAQDQTFTAKVAPLLQQHCISCHGPDAQESGLRLDSLQALNSGGK